MLASLRVAPFAAALRSALLTALRAYGEGKADRDEGMISAQIEQGNWPI